MRSADHDTRLPSLCSSLEELENVTTAACTLVECGQTVALIGLDRLFALVCAQTLDLPPEDVPLLGSDLVELVAAVDALSSALARQVTGA